MLKGTRPLRQLQRHNRHLLHAWFMPVAPDPMNIKVTACIGTEARAVAPAPVPVVCTLYCITRPNTNSGNLRPDSSPLISLRVPQTHAPFHCPSNQITRYGVWPQLHVQPLRHAIIMQFLTLSALILPVYVPRGARTCLLAYLPRQDAVCSVPG